MVPLQVLLQLVAENNIVMTDIINKLGVHERFDIAWKHVNYGESRRGRRTGAAITFLAACPEALRCGGDLSVVAICAAAARARVAGVGSRSITVACRASALPGPLLR